MGRKHVRGSRGFSKLGALLSRCPLFLCLLNSLFATVDTVVLYNYYIHGRCNGIFSGGSWPHPSTSNTVESVDESDGLNPGQQARRTNNRIAQNRTERDPWAFRCHGAFAFVPFLFSDCQIWIEDGKMAESSRLTACLVGGAKCQSAPQKALLFLLLSPQHFVSIPLQPISTPSFEPPIALAFPATKRS